MANLLSPRTSVNQPKYLARPDFSHPALSGALSIVYAHGANLILYDCKLRSETTLVVPSGASSAAIGTGINGSRVLLGPLFNGSSDTITVNASGGTPFANQNSFSIAAYVRVGSVTGDHTICTTNDAGGQNGIQFRTNTTGISLVDGGVAEIFNVGTVAVGESCAIGCTYDGTTGTAFKNGAIVGSGVSAQTLVHSTAKIGDRGNGSSFWNGNIYLIVFWSGVHPSRVSEITSDPWQIFMEPSRKFWPMDAAAATAKPLHYYRQQQ